MATPPWGYFGCPEIRILFQGVTYSPSWAYLGCPEIIILIQGTIYSPSWGYFGCPKIVNLFQGAIYSPSSAYFGFPEIVILYKTSLFYSRVPFTHRTGATLAARKSSTFPGCHLLTPIPRRLLHSYCVVSVAVRPMHQNWLPERFQMPVVL